MREQMARLSQAENLQAPRWVPLLPSWYRAIPRRDHGFWLALVRIAASLVTLTWYGKGIYLVIMFVIVVYCIQRRGKSDCSCLPADFYMGQCSCLDACNCQGSLPSLTDCCPQRSPNEPSCFDSLQCKCEPEEVDPDVSDSFYLAMKFLIKQIAMLWKWLYARRLLQVSAQWRGNYRA